MSMSDGTKVNSNSQPPNAKKKQRKTRQKNQKSSAKPSPLSTQISAPIARSQTFKVSEPRMYTGKKGVTIVAHRELLGSVNSNVSQTVWAILGSTGLGLNNSGVFRLNAGSESTNPWLAQVAKNFEFYRFRKLKFHYLTRCATTQTGSVMITPDYDAEDANPLSEQQAAMSVDTKEFVPWASVTVEMKPEKMNALYKAHTVMSDQRFPTTSQDTKTVDVGKVILSGDISVPLNTVATLGKLWVEYECELTVPQSPATTTSVTMNVNNQVLNPNVANVFPVTTLANVVANLNPKNPIFSNVPNFASANLGTLARNGAFSLLAELTGTGLTVLPNISLQNPNTGINTNIAPTAQLANGATTALTGRWEISPTLGVAGNIIGMFPIIATTIGAANLKLINNDPVPLGFAPITDP